MNRNQRIAIVLVGLAAAVIAFVVLSPGDDSGDDTTATTAPPITQTVPTPTGTDTETGTTDATTAPAQPAAPLLTAGRVREIRVSKGDVVRFRVRSTTPDEVHVHVYDITSDVQPGGTTRVAFKADVEGVFEIELHDTHTPIGKLIVEP